VVVLLAIVAVLLLAFGIVKLIALPFGGASLDLSIFYAIVLVFIVLGITVFLGRRRQRAALAKREAAMAARTGR
jgi:membrane protein implicated in regulation of membrane protease activity